MIDVILLSSYCVSPAPAFFQGGKVIPYSKSVDVQLKKNVVIQLAVRGVCHFSINLLFL